MVPKLLKRRKQGVYIGESKRTTYHKGSEHLKSIEKGNEDSPMVEHHLNEYRGQEMKFSGRNILSKKPLK